MIRERYKVVRVIRAQENYALLEAVDIAERETPLCLLNLYEGELLHRYTRICSGIRKEECPSFRGMFLENGTLIVAFDDCNGQAIDTLFYLGDKWKWEDRILFAEQLLHEALALANLPPEVSCAAMLSENVLFDLTAEKVRLRYMLPPMAEMNARELVLLTADEIKKILPLRLDSCASERALHERLNRGDFHSIVPLYAYWREMVPKMREEREQFKKGGFIRRGLTLLYRAIRKLIKRGGNV